MIVGIPKETFSGERRVAIVPISVSALTKAGLDVTVETAAGVSAGFPDAAYEAKGCRIVSDRASLFAEADIVLQILMAAAAGLDLPHSLTFVHPNRAGEGRGPEQRQEWTLNLGMHDPVWSRQR